MGSYSSEMDLLGGEIGSNHSYEVSGAGKIRYDTFHCCSFSLLLESNYFFHNYVVSVFPRLVFKAECHYITLVFNTHLFTLSVAFEAAFKDTCLKQAFHPLIKP